MIAGILEVICIGNVTSCFCVVAGLQLTCLVVIFCIFCDTVHEGPVTHFKDM